MKPCKHLDFSTEYTDCKIVTLPGTSVGDIRCWERGPTWLTYEGAPRFVQFCGAGRGRINDPQACYGDGCLRCYEPSEEAPCLP